LQCGLGGVPSEVGTTKTSLVQQPRQALTCNLRCARQDRFAIAGNDPDVPPSGMRQTGAPFSHGLVARSIRSVPSVKGAGHKGFLSHAPNDGVGENGRPRVFAALL